MCGGMGRCVSMERGVCRDGVVGMGMEWCVHGDWEGVCVVMGRYVCGDGVGACVDGCVGMGRVCVGMGGWVW